MAQDTPTGYRAARRRAPITATKPTRYSTESATSCATTPTVAARDLSGGQRQRVAIARPLAAEPRVLICDEITSDLDGETQEAIYDLLTTLRSGGGLSIVMISHDAGLVARHADRVLHLDAGRLHPVVREKPRRPEACRTSSRGEE